MIITALVAVNIAVITVNMFIVSYNRKLIRIWREALERKNG